MNSLLFAQQRKVAMLSIFDVGVEYPNSKKQPINTRWFNQTGRNSHVIETRMKVYL